MKLTEKSILANQIYGEDADEVLKFLAEVAPDKTEFRNKRSFLNFVAKKLEPLLKKKAKNSKQKARYQNVEFWNNRAMSMNIRNQVNKAKNVLWCIRLLDGKSGAPED